jgi:hypothetical protein
MACSQYNLSFGSPSIPTSYSFVDCNGSTITFTPELNTDYVCFADTTNPPPPSIGLKIDEFPSFSPSNLKFDNCCGGFSGILYLDDPGFPFVFSVGFFITTDGILYSGSSDICLTYNEGGDTTGLQPISLFKFPLDSYKGESCSECLLSRPCVTPTPTPTPTHTPTPTPTPTPLSKPIIPKFINECDPITLFPMGVECNLTHPSPLSSDGSISLTITGGTPPYYISWNNGNISPVIYNLSAGIYEATVIDSYGDFTATTKCTLTGSTPTPSPTPTPTPTSPYLTYDLCLVTNILSKGGSYVETRTNFTPNGLFNSRPSWISNDSTQSIYWDSSLSQWKVSASTPTTYTIFNTNPTYPPIYGSWFIIGGTGSIIVYEGPCEPLVGIFGNRYSTMSEEGVQPLTTLITKNQTICGCDGGLTIKANGGDPPYSYSINGGLTYRNIPMFSNLCSGTYNVIISDISGRTVNNTVILNPPSQPVTYNVKLVTLPKTLEANNTTLSKEYITTLSVTPELPDGVLLTFNLNHLNLSKSSPNEDSSSSETITSLTIDDIVIEPSTSSITNDSIINTVAGCQSNNVWLTSLTESWNSITINNTNVFKITTITTVTRNEFIDCYVGTSNETYSLSNLKITGCSCCSVITS